MVEFVIFRFLIAIVPIALIVWVVSVMWYRLRVGSWLFRRFPFSVKNYYILLSPVILLVLFDAWSAQSLAPLARFIVFALAGVVGETIFAEWWHAFFGKRFWVYRVETVVHAITSFLNFIPWALGGGLYFSIAYYFFPKLLPNSVIAVRQFLTIFSVLFLFCILVQFLTFYMVARAERSSRKFHHVSLWNYLFFVFPILIPVVILEFLYGPMVYGMVAAFGIIATLYEYLFGKATEFFISRKLWTYTYAPMDNGHFTPLSLLPFALGGFYFSVVTMLFFG